ncbi:MAG: NTP transferase domain-containing protein, partial [Candidatus Nanohaloarchaea archaeon]
MAKERISLTLDGDLVDRVDRWAAEHDAGNRSAGIESLLRAALKQEQVGTAVVLGGGPDSDCRIPINGRPVIEHVLDHLVDGGVGTVYVATGDHDLPDIVDDREIDVEFVLEEEPLGTAGALREIPRPDEPFLVVNGDVLCQA